jgi:septation ring formation regulator
MTKKWTRITFATTMMVLILVCSIFQPAFATEFPERGEATIVDPLQYFEQPERTNLRQYIANQPHKYVVVFLDQLEEDGFDYTRRLFDHYELGTDNVLFVITVTDESELYYAYGSKLTQKGLTDEFIESRKSVTFQPYVLERNYLTGVRSLIQAIELELENISAQREREAELIIEQEEAEAAEDAEAIADSSGYPWWVLLLAFIFIFLVLFMIFSFFYRRRIIKQVDQLENVKIQLENRPFTSQLARIKGLKMAGETEVRFDKWKAQWEDILNTTLPGIEETLIDIEDFADRYRFIKSNRVMEETRTKLEDIELSLDHIVQEIDELTSSEKNNREKVAHLHEQYQELKAALNKQSLHLGISYPVWYEKFKKTTSWFDQFNEAQNGGDYLSANDLLEAIDSVFKQLKEAIQETPVLIQEVEKNIPAQLRELDQAITEMKEKGYLLEHTDVEKRFEEISRKQHEVVLLMENGQIKEMKQWIQQTLDEVDTLFGVLEDEVESKAFVLSAIEGIPDHMKEISTAYHQVLEDSRLTKASYSWETDWEDALTSITKQFKEIEHLYKKLEMLEEDVNHSYPAIKPELVRFQEFRVSIHDAIDGLIRDLSQLREEELKAQEISSRLKQTIVKIKVTLRKSNLPGIPEHLQTGLTMAEESLADLNEKLEQLPLEMNRVQHHLKETKSQVESVAQVAKSVIQQAVRAEQYIQFGNRYRRYDSQIEILLDEAETAFRRLQYRESLELAEEALDLADRQWREKLGVDEESTG